MSLIWFTIGAMGIVALAAGVEESWVRTNILWDVLGAFWVAGWNVRSNAQRTQMWSWRGTGGGRGEEDDLGECFEVRNWVGIRRKQGVVEIFDCVLHVLHMWLSYLVDCPAPEHPNISQVRRKSGPKDHKITPKTNTRYKLFRTY